MPYLDLSTFTKTNVCYAITSVGDATILGSGGYFGSGRLSLDGNGDYLTVPDNNDWNRTSNFTIDFWVKITAHDSDISGFCGQGGNATSGRWRLRYYNSNLEYEFWNGVTQVLMQRSWSPSLDTWYHVTLVRNSNDYYMFIDGTQIGTTFTSATAPGNASATLDIGRCFDAGGYKYLNGYMNEFRFSSSARWTSNFTPSISEYTSDINTQLLLHLMLNTNDFSDDYFIILTDVTGENNNKITFTTFPSTNTSYMYKDFGVGNFDNFEVLFDLKITKLVSAGSQIGILKITNTLGTGVTGIYVYLDAQSTSQFKIRSSSPGYAYTSANYNVNTDYYLRVVRLNGCFGMEIYDSASDRDNKIGRLEVIYLIEGSTKDTTTYRYLYPIFGYGSSADSISGYITNFEVTTNDTSLGTPVSEFIGQGDTTYIDSSGNIHISGHYYASTGKVYYQVSTDGGNTFTDGEGGGSGSAKFWTMPSGKYPVSTAIVVDSSDNVFLFYQRGKVTATQGDIYMLKKSSGVWGSEVNISNTDSFTLYSLRAEIDINDNIIVIGSGYYSGRFDGLIVCTSDDAGANWIKEFGNYDDAYTFSDLTIDKNNDGWYVHFTDYGGWDAEVHKADRSGTYDWDWLGEYNNRTGVTVYGSAILAERDTDNVWEFLSILDGSYYKLQYSKYNGSTWSAWQTIDSRLNTDGKRYYNLSAVRDYDNQIYLTYNLYDGTTNLPPIYMMVYSGSEWSPSFVFRESGVKCSLQQPNLVSGASKLFYTYEHYVSVSNFMGSYNVTQVITSDTIGLEEEKQLRFEIEIDENLFLTENLSLTKEQLIDENITVSDEVIVNVNIEKIYPSESATLSDDVLVSLSSMKDIDNDFRFSILTRININNFINTVIQVLKNINNKINFVKQELFHIVQKCNTAVLTINNVKSAFHSVYGIRQFILNKIGTLGITKSDINNDFRIKFAWQKAGLAGAQSLGKEYIKVYFNSGGTGDIDVEQIDVDVDSISIGKVINASHNASLVLARPYDASKPAFETIVKIKYNDYLLYKGKIVTVNPTDNPEHISIECLDKYWDENRQKTWAYVGHILTNNHAGSISNPVFLQPFDFLTEWGFLSNFEGGHFIPQTIDVFDTPRSDAITEVITNCGNFGWYYDENDVKRIWRGGAGSIINVEKQEIGKNIGLYQVINHQITESVENLVNKLRVELGTSTRVIPGRQQETREYKQHWLSTYRISAIPDWDSGLEGNASRGGYGYNYHKPGTNYGDVFKKFRFMTLFYDPTIQGGWTDIIPPYVVIETGFGQGLSIPSGKLGKLEEGYSIDWDEGTLTLNEPFYFYDVDSKGRVVNRRAPNITLILTREKYITRTEVDGHDTPDQEIESQLGFITEKMGDYPVTVLDVLSLEGLSNQESFTYASRATSYGTSRSTSISYVNVPGWNDNPFGGDIASWHLSKTCDPKITGTITLTLDAVLFYGIDLTKRIMIPGILTQPLNIMSMSYNMSDFTVTLNVENWRYFNRSVNFVSHGEGISSAIINPGV